jgi:hypothetical protein
MTTIARGSETVRELQRALGGTAPKAPLQKSRAELERYVIGRSKIRARAYAEMARLHEPLRNLIFRDVAKDDPRLKKIIQDAKAASKRARKRTVKLPKPEKFEPRFVAGSGFWFKSPPYDTSWTWGSQTNVHSSANSSAGTFHLDASIFADGLRQVAAGIGIFFLALDDDPQQRFSALIDYSDSWHDHAAFYVAHNDLNTRLWVWGETENAWVGQGEVTPGWTDGVGWIDTHGNEPLGDDGRASGEIFWTVDVYRGDGRRYLVQSDELLTAFLELEEMLL